MTNKYLTKISEELKPHQVRALNKLDKTDGLVLDHGMGSGKTRLFLTAVERELARKKEGRALIVAPASLQSNIEQEIKKHNLNIDLSRVDVRSYQKAVNDSDELRKNRYVIAVADEAHAFRNTGTARHRALSDIIENADKRLLATGTTGYNHVSDIAPLVNMASGGARMLPEGKKAFEEEYINKEIEQPPMLKRILGGSPHEVHSLKNQKELKRRLSAYVDHYTLEDNPETLKEFPRKTEKVVEVEMSHEQKVVYKYLEDKLPFHLKLKVRMNLPLDKKESASLNAFSTGIRQASNSIKPFMEKSTHVTPKIHTAVKNLVNHANSDKNFKGLVYSNYLGAGLEDYSTELTKAGVPHVLYHGGLNPKQKDQIVKDYNEDKNRVILVSSSGAEGLNLKGTKVVQILEPHHNVSKINQVIARARRYKSHAHLPEKEREVQVEHYHSVFPKGIFGQAKSHSIDQYLYHNSGSKNTLDIEMKRLLKDEQ